VRQLLIKRRVRGGLRGDQIHGKSILIRSVAIARGNNFMKKMGTLFVLVLALLTNPAMADQTATFTLPSGVNVDIVEAEFEKFLFKIEVCSQQDPICRINDQIPMGVASGLPRTYIKSIIITFKGQSYPLDISSMYNAWGSRPLEYSGVIRYFGRKCVDTKFCQFRGLFSDGAGSFVAEWKIVGGKTLRTVLTDSDDVFGLFMKNIDPPEYY
jgi:hypothetical protein